MTIQNDGYENILTGLGTQNDPTTFTRFIADKLTNLMEPVADLLEQAHLIWPVHIQYLSQGNADFNTTHVFHH